MKLFLFFFTVVLLAACGGGKEQQFENAKGKTNRIKDSIETLSAFPLNGYLITGTVMRYSLDTIKIIYKDKDSTVMEKVLIPAIMYRATFQFPDSIRDSITHRALRPKLDSLGKQAYFNQYFYYPDSLAYFPKELDIRKIKRDHNLK